MVLTGSYSGTDVQLCANKKKKKKSTFLFLMNSVEIIHDAPRHRIH